MMEIHVELEDTTLLESYGKLEELQNRIRHQLRTVLGIEAKITLVEPYTLKRFEGKAKRVKDNR